MWAGATRKGSRLMSDNLGFARWAENAVNPYLDVNDALERIDAFLTNSVAVDLSSGNANIATAAAQQALLLIVTGATVARTITLPAVRRLYKFDLTSIASEVTVTITKGTTSIAAVGGACYDVYSGAGANELTKLGAGGSGSGGASLPSQTGNSGKFLTTDGSALSWGTPAGGGSGSGSGGGGKPWYFKPPLAADFPIILNGMSGVGGANPSVVDDPDAGLIVAWNAATSSNNYIKAVYKTVPDGNWTVTAKILPLILLGAATSYSAGLGVRRNVAGGLGILFGRGMDGAGAYTVVGVRHSITAASGAGTHVWDFAATTLAAFHRITYTKATDILRYEVSLDGKTFITANSSVATSSTHLNGQPTEVGFALHSNSNAGNNLAVTAEYWSQSW